MRGEQFRIIFRGEENIWNRIQATVEEFKIKGVLGEKFKRDIGEQKIGKRTEKEDDVGGGGKYVQYHIKYIRILNMWYSLSFDYNVSPVEAWHHWFK